MTNLHKTLTAIAATLLALALLSAAVAMAAGYSPSASTSEPFMSQANVDVVVDKVEQSSGPPFVFQGNTIDIDAVVRNDWE